MRIEAVAAQLDRIPPAVPCVRPDFVKLAPYEVTPEQLRSLDLRTAKAA
ncbi:MAG TPA: hypothetical protein VG370_10900 [Chloroflexota bacterium]|jgi:hypothetical protein|nr:hypothetical protein [Chloroflexota bacterium]